MTALQYTESGTSPPTASSPGRVHTQGFGLIFCSRGCGNFCETLEPDLIRSTTTFTCRVCNPVSNGQQNLSRPTTTWHQFDRTLGASLRETEPASPTSYTFEKILGSPCDKEIASREFQTKAEPYRKKSNAKPDYKILDGTGALLHVTDETGNAFWVPRDADKKRHRAERVKLSRARECLRAPCWRGEPRPDAQTVRLESRFPDADYLRELVELGYDPRAAAAAIFKPPFISDRRGAQAFHQSEEYEVPTKEFGSIAQPFLPQALPSLRTTNGGYRKQTVVAAIARHNWDAETNQAVFEVVYMQRRPWLVAASLGLNPETVHSYANRLRQDIRQVVEVAA